MIEVQDLTKTFNGKTVVNGLNFQVREGEIFGFLGPNGAGKTTTMRIILGLLRPTSGKALVFGDDLGSNDDLRRKVGILLENDGLYDGLSAYENLDYYAQLYNVTDREEKIKNLLDFAGLTERKDDKVGTFSKGMKRKLGLARAMIHDPDVLFLDHHLAWTRKHRGWSGTSYFTWQKRRGQYSLIPMTLMKSRRYVQKSLYFTGVQYKPMTGWKI